MKGTQKLASKTGKLTLQAHLHCTLAKETQKRLL